jgi:hypothetical protein
MNWLHPEIEGLLHILSLSYLSALIFQIVNKMEYEILESRQIFFQNIFPKMKDNKLAQPFCK